MADGNELKSLIDGIGPLRIMKKNCYPLYNPTSMVPQHGVLLLCIPNFV
jgi:hypothetical protein